MCLICIELEKNKLSFKEGIRNFQEMKVDLDKEHIKVVQQKLIDKMVEENKKKYEELQKTD
jgi:hypothetical protein|tara:strand:- start:825 stop:1007 length:183 start_codon:yes stop_codon:yes gene_type:complete